MTSICICVVSYIVILWTLVCYKYVHKACLSQDVYKITRAPVKHFITRQRLGSGSHTRIGSPHCIFNWADYYAGSSPGALLCPFQYTDPAIHKGSTSACDAEHTRLCAGSSQGDVRSRWVPGTDGQGLVLFLTALLLCRHGAFTREDICIGNVFYFIKVFGRRHQTEFGGEQWCCPLRVSRREKVQNHFGKLCMLMQPIILLDCVLKIVILALTHTISH